MGSGAASGTANEGAVHMPDMGNCFKQQGGTARYKKGDPKAAFFAANISL